MLAAISSKTTSSIKIYQSTMCNVYRSVGSLTTIKSHLQRNNVAGLTSLNELIAFQKNYSTSRQQVISKHELSITQEKNDLNSEISQLDQRSYPAIGLQFLRKKLKADERKNAFSF